VPCHSPCQGCCCPPSWPRLLLRLPLQPPLPLRLPLQPPLPPQLLPLLWNLAFLQHRLLQQEERYRCCLHWGQAQPPEVIPKIQTYP
jgi:hypothetical protein